VKRKRRKKNIIKSNTEPRTPIDSFYFWLFCFLLPTLSLYFWNTIFDFLCLLLAMTLPLLRGLVVLVLASTSMAIVPDVNIRGTGTNQGDE
jgi:hypothetical protein